MTIAPRARRFALKLPPPKESPHARLAARTVQRITLGIIILGFVLHLPAFLITQRESLVTSPYVYILIVAFIGIVGAHQLARAGYAETAAVALALLMAAGLFGIAFLGTVLDVANLNGLFIPLLIVAMFTHGRQTVTLAFGLGLLLLAIALCTSDLTLREFIVYQPISYLVVTSILLTLLKQYRDAQEQMRQRALRQSDERYRLLMRHLPRTGVVLFDPQLNILLAGGPILDDLGYAEIALEHRTIYEVMLPDRRERLLPLYEAAARGVEQSSVLELGASAYLMLFVPVCDEQALPLGGMVVIVDMTEARRAEEVRLALALEQRQHELIRKAVQDVSHEVRTPLSLIMTSIALMRRKLSDAEREPIDRHLATIEGQVVHLTQELDRLLTIQRLSETVEAEQAQRSPTMG